MTYGKRAGGSGGGRAGGGRPGVAAAAALAAFLAGPGGGAAQEGQPVPDAAAGAARTPPPDAGRDGPPAPGGGAREPGAREPGVPLGAPTTPLERLQAPEAFPAGRDRRYFAAPPLFGNTPTGRRVGDLVVGGSASSSVSYDSNVDARSGGGGGGSGGGDAVLATNLTLQASPILRRHALAFLGSITAAGVLPDTAASNVALDLGAAGTLDLSRRSALDGALTFSRQIETPATPDSVSQGADDGTRTLDRVSASAAYARRYRRSSLAFGPGLAAVFYEDDNGDNYLQPSVGGRYTYEVSPRLDVGFSPELVQTVYAERDDDGTDRDSLSLAASVGATYALGRESVAALSVGYQRTEYADSSRGSSQGLIFGAGLSGRLGERTSGSFRASRTFNPTSNAGDADGATVTRADLAVQRAIGRRLGAFGDLGATLLEYETAQRTDVLVDAGVGLTQAWSGTVDLSVRAGYAERFSDVPDGRFRAWTVTAGVTKRF